MFLFKTTFILKKHIIIIYTQVHRILLTRGSFIRMNHYRINQHLNPFYFSIVFILISVSCFSSAQPVSSSEWKTYENLGEEFDAPSGIPDFDQRQKEKWCWFNGHPFYCGPTSTANVLWYMDCKHDTHGENKWNLVSGVHHPDLVVPLIEEIAQKTKTNILRATLPVMLKRGLEQYLQEQQVDEFYKVIHIEKPAFIDIQTAVMSGHMVLLNIHFGHMPFTFWKGHWVTVHGCKQLVHNYGQLQLSDPVANKNQSQNEDETYTIHNNPSVVSHDMYTVMPSYFWWEAKIMILNLWQDLIPQPYQGHVKDAVIIQDFSL